LWLPGFFTLPPGDRDESRFAQASKQMNESGDYVRIMNGRVPRNRKPIGIYWLQAPVAAVAGPGLANPIWPYRVPSLLGGMAAVLATYAAGRRLVGRWEGALLAGGMLAACVILATETHIAKTDAALLGATTVAMAVLSRAWQGARVARWQAALFWLAMGAGVLLKGPITPMVAGLAVAMLCVWERRGRWLLALRPGWGAPLMLAVVLPWFVAIGLATHGAFFADAVGGDLGAKLSGGSEAHGAPPGVHLLLLPLLAFPGTAAVLAGLVWAWRERREAAVRFLVAWAGPSWLVFEAVPTKLPHYTLPLYPALFLLAARGVGRPAAAWVRIGGGVLLWTAAGVIGGAAVALPVFLDGAWWLGLPALGCAGAVALLAWRGRLLWAVALCMPLYASILQFELPALGSLWIAPRVEAALRRDWPGWNAMGDGLALAGYAEPSLVFLTGTHTQLLPNGRSAADALVHRRAEMAVVTSDDLAACEAALRAAGYAPRVLDEVSGFNYSRGRWMRLELVAPRG
jgi:4-amino-4-deoxy-L-arabinose transferase-like glycosyltransferase